MDRREFLVETIVGIVGLSGLDGIAQAMDLDEPIHGLIARADVPNSNGRVYPRKVLEKVVQDFNQRYKSSKSMLGQLGMLTMNEVEFSKASHLVKDLRMENDYLVGDFKIIATPCGDKLRELLKETKVAFRTAGTGSVVDGIISDDYQLTSVCAVSVEDAAKI